MTVQQFANAMESAIGGDADNQLGITGSSFAFDVTSGQIIFESGSDGARGEISIAASENIQRALGMQITTESEAAAFKVAATTTGVSNPTTTSANTTTDTASGVIEGLDLNFQIASEARHDGSESMTEAIYISGTSDVVFTLHDTNANKQYQANSLRSNGVTIRLTAGRAYSTASIAAVVNSTVAVTNNTNHPLNATAFTAADPPVPTAFQSASEGARNPGITASMDGYNLVLTSSVEGSSGTISVASNTAATQFLGLKTVRLLGMVEKMLS